MLEDIQDEDDYAQFLEVLKLAGKTEAQAYAIIDKWKRLTARKHQALLRALPVINQLEKPKYKSPLSCIIFPDDQRLVDMPIFHRFIAYLISEYGKSKTSLALGTNRMTLYRWLVSHGYEQD